MTTVSYVDCNILYIFITTYRSIDSCVQIETKNSEDDQEIPESQTADNPMAPRGRANQP